jgi:hypothetical protein
VAHRAVLRRRQRVFQRTRQRRRRLRRLRPPQQTHHPEARQRAPTSRHDALSYARCSAPASARPRLPLRRRGEAPPRLGAPAPSRRSPSPTSPAPPAAEAPTSPTRDDADADAAADAALRTANDDRRSFDNQPDYEGEAAGLRAYVDARLGEIKADEPAAACTRMLDAAAAFYAAVEREEAQRSALLAALSATRESDHEACVRETSLEAAACVVILLGDRSAELPWLLDQCSRAYPRR